MLMRRFLTTFCVMLMVACADSAALATEISTSKWGLVQEQISRLEKGDMLISDAVGVIFYPQDQVLSPLHNDTYQKYLKEIEAKEGQKKRRLLDSAVKQAHKSLVVSHDLLDAYKDAIKRGVDFLVLTSGRTGSYGSIDELMDFRHERIRSLGLNVTQIFEKKFLTLTNLHNVEGNPAIFNRGILFANRNDKGESLELFLEAVKKKPKKIVYIDNRMRQVDSVKRICDRHGIEFVGIHYTKVYELSNPQLDRKIVDKQFSYLQSRLRWLSDEQAQCMIQHDDNLQFCQDF